MQPGVTSKCSESLRNPVQTSKSPVKELYSTQTNDQDLPHRYNTWHNRECIAIHANDPV